MCVVTKTPKVKPRCAIPSTHSHPCQCARGLEKLDLSRPLSGFSRELPNISASSTLSQSTGWTESKKRKDEKFLWQIENFAFLLYDESNPVQHRLSNPPLLIYPGSTLYCSPSVLHIVLLKSCRKMYSRDSTLYTDNFPCGLLCSRPREQQIVHLSCHNR